VVVFLEDGEGVATKLSTPRPGGLRDLFLSKEPDFLPPAHLFEGSKPTQFSFSSQRIGLMAEGQKHDGNISSFQSRYRSH